MLLVTLTETVSGLKGHGRWRDIDTLLLKPTHDYLLLITVGSVVCVDKLNEPFSRYSLGCGATFHLSE